MIKYLLAILGIFIFTAYIPLTAQSAFPENDYRSKDNKWYWKNRPPFPGYWQQDVHYRINAELHDKSNTIQGNEELTYWNNSPDTLEFVYFHLYQNAFQPGSYMHELFEVNKINTFFGFYEKKGLGTRITKMESDGKALKMELDNTILKVYLAKPLLPNASVSFKIDFTTFFDGGSMRRRMKIFLHDSVKHYDGVHWYPRISVYDRKMGWTYDQHLGREFYGDYGTYDVSLTMPAYYIMDATGELVNKEEAMPESLRKKLDIKNFVNKPWEEKPSVIIPRSEEKKTWRYHAMNVHDFAWTADPTYRIGETVWNGVSCIALAQETHAGRWQDASDFIAKVIETYSRDFGMYIYPKIIVADARDGMEYPMLTLCGGMSPDYHEVIAHEVGHNWFFGMLGNNETYRAFMDEGFTQFLTIWSSEAIDGKYMAKSPSASKYVQKHSIQQPIRDERLYMRYLRDARDANNIPINTHSDDFASAVRHGGGYSQVYHRAGTMLYNLQYLLGDTLFKQAMQHYVDQWKVCHPYPEDFRNSITHFTHANLAWFFDEWLETTKYTDYAIKSLKNGDSTGYYTLTLERKGEMQMPVEFTVIYKDGKKKTYLVPNTYFAKKTDATILPVWIGWGKLNQEYKAYIPEADGRIYNIILDTSDRLADVNMLDNRLKFPLKVRFDYNLYTSPDRNFYEMFFRPDFKYNRIDGIKAGLNFNGDYADRKHFFNLTTWYNTHIREDGKIFSLVENPVRDWVSFEFSYFNPIPDAGSGLSWNMQLRSLDGLYLGKIGITKDIRGNNTLTVDYKSMQRRRPEDQDYLLYPLEWNSGRWNSTINAELRHTYRMKRSLGNMGLALRTTAPGSDYAYSGLKGDVLHTLYYKKFVLKNRFVAQGLMGPDVAPESQLFFAQANPEEMMENKYVRSRGIVPLDWLAYSNTTNHFQYGGGLNMRGYSGYLLPANQDTPQTYTYKGLAGAAVNLELEFDRYLKWKPKKISQYLGLSTYLFLDAGIINSNKVGQKLTFAEPRMDAGLGTALTIKKWGVLQKPKPLTIRLDMPFYLSHTPFIEQGQNFKLRWLVSVNRAF